MWYLVTVCCSLGVWNLVCSRKKVPTTLTSSKDLGHCVCNELLWWTALHTGGHSSVLEDWSVSFVTSLGEESLKLVVAFFCAPHCIFSPGWFFFILFCCNKSQLSSMSPNKSLNLWVVWGDIQILQNLISYKQPPLYCISQFCCWGIQSWFHLVLAEVTWWFSSNVYPGLEGLWAFYTYLALWQRWLKGCVQLGLMTRVPICELCH